MRKYIGRSSRDSAGDTLDPQWYEENGAIIRSHWGSETVISAADALAELEEEVRRSAAYNDQLAVFNAQQTIGKIKALSPLNRPDSQTGETPNA